MAFTLDQESVSNLIEYVDRNVRLRGCDHSHRFSSAWAKQYSVNWDDLLDALEATGAFCDCEVVCNLEDKPLTYSSTTGPLVADNRWLLPPNFDPGLESPTTKIILSRADVGRNTHTKDGEWLVPAPADAKPRKRVRKLSHFFIGVETGLPSEIGFVADVEPMTIARFAHTMANSGVPELQDFDRKIAAFVLGRIAKLPDGAPIACDLMERVGLSSKHRELNIHRVFLRR